VAGSQVVIAGLCWSRSGYVGGGRGGGGRRRTLKGL
jgi:hypothetical protein